jgi:lysophospholipase L1-like esterase
MGADRLRSYLALGDSYTAGEGVDANDRWGEKLAVALSASGKQIRSPDIIAKTGWTTKELIDAIGSSGNAKVYSIVSLQIGVNNQYRGQDTGRYRHEFRELLTMAVAYCEELAGGVFSLSIPDYGGTPFAKTLNPTKISREIDQYNAVARQECANVGIAFIDITDLSRQAEKDISMIADDGLHYSGKMYAKWAARVLPVVLKMIR